MGFQAHQAVDDMRAGFFQAFGPLDVIFFVKAGFELHEDRNLLAVLCGFHQGSDNGRIAADSVQRLLNGQHLGIKGGLAYEVYYRFKAFVGMVQ